MTPGKDHSDVAAQRARVFLRCIHKNIITRCWLMTSQGYRGCKLRKQVKKKE